MKILLINHYAGSYQHGMEYRPYYLAREWIRLGHSVTIVASSVSHVRRTPLTVSKQVTEEIIDRIRYLWIKTLPYTENGIARAINIFSFVGQLLFYSHWLSRTIDPDVVIASSTYPLDIIAARMIARRSNARLIFEVHDLWPLSPIELGGMSRNHPFIVLMQWAENIAYTISDKVISMLPGTMNHMLNHGMMPEKFVYIPNGVDVNEWQVGFGIIPDEHLKVFTILKKKENFLVGYTGAHGLANALDQFIEAANQLQEYPVTFILIGQGPEKNKLRQKVDDRKQTNVFFLPPVDRKVIPSILNEMDVLFIGLKGDPLFRFGVSPNKLMDYMMAAKPVIHAIRAGNDMVSDCGCGFSIPPEDPDAIAQAVLSLMHLSEAERIEMGQRGKKYVMAKLDYRVLAQQFIDVIQ